MTSTVEDPHWAPPAIVLAKRLLSHAAHLQVAWDEQAVGVSGQLTPDRPLPVGPGVFALAEAGIVRYVGHAEHLARAFGPRGLGRASAKDCLDARRAEDCRLHRLILEAAAQGRVVDVYLLTDRSAVRRPWWRRREAVRSERDTSAEAARIRAAAHGDWQG